jgi:TonB family protein
MYLLRSLLIFALTASVFGQGSSPYAPELDAIAERLGNDVQSARRNDFSPKVLVIDFLNQKEQVSALGDILADQLSSALVEKVGQVTVVSRKQFRERLLSTGISPFDLEDIEAARWTAQQAGANVIVFGHLLSSHEKVTLRIELVRVSSGKKFSKASTDLSLTEEMKNLFDKPLDWPDNPDLAVSCVASAQRDEVAAFKAAGVTEPKCVRCLMPTYTDSARAARIQGIVKVKIVIDEEGRPKSGVVILGNSHELELQALRAIKEWRFEPAKKAGKPVSVCVVTEVNFRIF